MIFRPKNHQKSQKHQKSPKWPLFGCREKCQNRSKSSSTKPKWVPVPTCEGVSQRGVQNGTLFWSKMGHFWGLFRPSFDHFLQLNLEYSGFIGVSKRTPKITLFQKCQKYHFLDTPLQSIFEQKLKKRQKWRKTSNLSSFWCFYWVTFRQKHPFLSKTEKTSKMAKNADFVSFTNGI